MRTATPTPPLRSRSVGATTLGRMVLDATAEHSGVAASVERDGRTLTWSYGEFGELVRQTAAGLFVAGIDSGDRVAIFADTSPEWTLLDCAALTAGATVVPIYASSSPEECAYILKHSGARMVVCGSGRHAEIVGKVRDRCPALEDVVVVEGADVPGVVTLGELRGIAGVSERERVHRAQEEITDDDIATIVYTSGTTGPPKGCVLTHRAVLSAVRMYEERLALAEPMVIFMFLPLAHALARVTQMVALDVGATIAYWSGDPDRLLDDVRAANPTHLPAVPRLFEKIHAQALGRIEESTGPRERIARAALAAGAQMRDAESPSPSLRLRHAIADRLLLRKIRALFGDRLELALTGASPIAPDVIDFFGACGIPVLEGYGLTETCAAATLNVPGAMRVGTVGRPLPGMEVRIAADGEILMGGPCVFSGYLDNPEATAATLDDGWLRTGDVGEIDEDGYLRITGRKKELIITSSGKNIAPLVIEAALRESRYIAEAVVFGDRRPYLVALLTIDPDEAPGLARAAGVPEADPAALATDERILAVLAREVARTNARFAPIEQIKRFAVLERAFTADAGELTPTLKVKRDVVYGAHAERFEALYDPAAPSLFA